MAAREEHEAAGEVPVPPPAVSALLPANAVRAPRRERHKRRRRRHHHHDEKECFICRQAVANADAVHYCNCTFLYAHREPCLVEWARERANCRMCALLYDVNRVRDTCFVCLQHATAEERIYPCRCAHVIVHEQCMQHLYDQGRHACALCGATFALQTITTCKFTRQKALRLLPL